MKVLFTEVKTLVRRPNRTSTISLLPNIPKMEVFKNSDEVIVDYYKDKIVIRMKP